jgi:hypothetical protein
MKRAALAILAIVVCYLELQDDLAFWLPSVGALDSGYVIAQTAVLALVAVIVFGGAISLSYRVLNWIFE